MNKYFVPSFLMHIFLLIISAFLSKDSFSASNESVIDINIHSSSSSAVLKEAPVLKKEKLIEKKPIKDIKENKEESIEEEIVEEKKKEVKNIKNSEKIEKNEIKEKVEKADIVKKKKEAEKKEFLKKEKIKKELEKKEKAIENERKQKEVREKIQKEQAEKFEKLKKAEQAAIEEERRILKQKHDEEVANAAAAEQSRINAKKALYRQNLQEFIMDLQDLIKQEWAPPEEFAKRSDIVIHVQIKIDENGKILDYRFINYQDTPEYKAVAASVVRLLNSSKINPLPLKGRKINATVITLSFCPKDVF